MNEGLVPIHHACGARVEFHGCVRDNDQGKTVTHLRYTAHEQAEYFLRQCVKDCEIHQDTYYVYVRHCLGTLRIGDEALCVIVDASHREEAFSLAQRIVTSIKRHVPIWKEQFYTDGTADWSGCP